MTAGLILIALSGIGLTRPVENASYQLLSPLESLLRSLATPIANVVTNYGDVKDLTAENEQLRTENERLNSEIARLREDATQREQLERLLNVKNALKDQTFATAQVTSRDTSNLRQVIAVNLGSQDGIKKGMPVVTEGSTLVGTITKVEDSYSWVTLV